MENSRLPQSIFLVATLLLLLLTPFQVPNTSITKHHLLPLMLLAHGYHYQSLQPQFIKNMDAHTVVENTPIDEIIYQLEAKPSEDLGPQTKIEYNIEGTSLFKVDKISGQVRVAQLIDREQTGDQVTFFVSATVAYLPTGQQQQRQGPTSRLSTTVLILDENDNAPRIERVRVKDRTFDSGQLNRLSSFARGAGGQHSPTVRLSVSESLPPESIVVDLVEAIDVDKASQNPLRSMCLDCDGQFELRPTSDLSLNDKLNFSIVLIAPLVHVPRNNIRLLNLIVNDGLHNSSIQFEITIDDVQNKPPQFIGSTTCIVAENIPIDKTIMTVQAVDGDAIGQDDSFISLVGAKQLQGRLILYDLINNENSAINMNFKLHPLTGQLQVANRLDREAYLSYNGVLSLGVRARELTVSGAALAAAGIREDDLYDSILDKSLPYIDQSPEASSEADISVILLDVNDNAPRWLNSTEIAQLNMNQSPNWFASLPNDLDTGRIYRVAIKENSLVGSPITFKNEMFVYDLDNGENSVFNISIDDPSNLFDVEPKQASGFALVTLKLASHKQHQAQKRTRLLDYENPNERGFVIDLIATETNTREALKSRAPVHIVVLDVNDNAPEFKEQFYRANVREDAPVGKTVLQVKATDRDEISQSLSYSLHGKSAHLFDINPVSGHVTVAKCPLVDESNSESYHQQDNHLQTPNRLVQRQSSSNAQLKSCLDYEQQREHHLMVEASDGELSNKVPLTIYIDDASDNPPVFSLPVVEAVIEEGSERLDPPIKIEATDVDRSSVISYSIVEGNFEGLFSLNNATGELQLTRPIRILHADEVEADGITTSPMDADDFRLQHQQQPNKITLIIEATDGVYKTNGTIQIDVLDSNDNAPKFVKPQYAVGIPESSAPGTPVVTVRAIDSDRGNNAKVSYRIERGSFHQFEIDETSGLISVSSAAQEFDSSKRENFTLEVVAYDHGLVARSSSVVVQIRVLDTNPRVPEFEPQIQRATISENTPNNTIFHHMSLAEQDALIANLVFDAGPIEALDKNGLLVAGAERDRLESMFSVSSNTGDVIVNSPLDHDFAAYINLTIYVSVKRVRDQGFELSMASGEPSMGPEVDPMSSAQTLSARSVGYLIINVVDDNSNAPIFAAPWSMQQPELSFQMAEELPVGSVLTQLVASDVDSKISHFKIEPPNEYFELSSPQSGVIVNRKLIDYDSLMGQTFRKPGQRNSNHSAALVMAANLIQFNVFVYDSGTPQLSAKAMVTVEILPVNDWDCKFEKSVYEARVRENPAADTFVVQVRAIDQDYGEQHNLVRYQLIGEHKDMFNIDPRTGFVSISTNGSAQLDRERLEHSTFTLTVLGRDEQQQVGSGGRNLRGSSSSRSCLASIVIHVDDVNDNPPLFSQKFYEVTAYDTDAIDVPLIKTIIRDEDSQHPNHNTTSSSRLLSLQPTNTFKILSGNLNESFNITNSGLIYATKPLNETFAYSNEPIQLRVQVKQQSPNVGSFTDECIVRVNFVKINRFGPEWRQDSLKNVVVEENSKPGTLVAQLRCTDRDYETKSTNRLVMDQDDGNQRRLKASSLAAPSPIRYYIKENGVNVVETPEFRLNSTSGNLVTRVELDRESQEYYQLIVVCEDNGRPQSLESITTLLIRVLDVDDNKPKFLIPKTQETSSLILRQTEGQSTGGNQNSRPVINFSVEEHQITGLQVGELKAIDSDIDTGYAINYCLIEGNEYREFALDRVTGILYTNQTLDRERQSTYDLLVKAINSESSTCEEHIVQYNLLSGNGSLAIDARRQKPHDSSFVLVKVDVLDINDNPPLFRRPVYRAGALHRSLMNTLVTQVAASDPDSGLNGTLNYRISETLMYKTAPVQQVSVSRKYEATIEQPLGRPIQLMQSPFKIDQQGNVYTQQMLTQYQLMSMFELQIEATELAEPRRTATTKLEIYLYETNNQLKIKINLHPRLVDAYKSEIETLLSNATKYTAIINRARSYHGTSDSGASTRVNLRKAPQATSSNQNNINQRHRNTMDSSFQLPNQIVDEQQSLSSATSPSYTNILLIFVDNYRIVNPNLVMEKFDLTSAQLFMSPILSSASSSSLQQQQQNGPFDSPYPSSTDANGRNQQVNSEQVSSIIDKIALASVQSAEYTSSSSSLAGIDWLESPSVIFATLTAILTIVGFIVCLMGCCCTSRIKDHIIKVAMNKLVEQQNIQAKINERVLANANENGASSQLNVSQHHQQMMAANGSDYLLSQGGLMSSFDATKGCINNNTDNMNIMQQRALETGEYIDPNYTTLNGRVNLGAHYYDASDLDQQYQQQSKNIDEDTNYHNFDESQVVEDFRSSSPNLIHDQDDNDGNNNNNNENRNHDDNHDLNKQPIRQQHHQQQKLANGNGVGVQRQRQQVPQ